MTAWAQRLAMFVAMCAVIPSASAQLIVAHRGASHDAPENTMAAFRLAMEQGADAFEADFFLTSEGQIVCFHDKDTERITGKKLSITETQLAKLRDLDVGQWKGPRWKGERMPTMEEVLAAVPDGKKIFIELKSSAEIVGPMVEVIEHSKLTPEQMVVISFHADAVAECKKRLPHIKAYWLCGFKEKDDGTPPPTADEVIAILKRTRADGLDAQAVPEHFNEAFIERLREAGYGDFHVWTVDDPAVARFYIALGVASITTNRPGWLREQLER